MGPRWNSVGTPLEHPPKHMIVGLGGPSREDMLKYPSDLYIYHHPQAYARQTRISKSARYASLCFKPVVSQERKSTVFMKKYKWPSKDARGPAHHFGGRTDSIGQDLRG